MRETDVNEKRKKKKIVSIGLCIAILAINRSFVLADTEDKLLNSELIEQVGQEDFEAESIEVNKEGVTAELEDIAVYLPETSDEFVIIENREDEEIIEMSMGIAIDKSAEAIIEDEIIFYLDDEKDYSASVQVAEGSVRQSFIIGSENSPEVYEIEMQLPDNGYMEFAEFEGEKDGSIIICNGEKEPVAAIDIPWAIDSNGNNLTTYYEIDGNKLLQIVEHGSKAVSYPVIADPTLTFSSYFSSGKWIERGGTYSTTLSLKPKAITRTNAGAILGWAKVQAKFKNTSKWRNATGLYNQYICHQQHATTKSEWNLEPARPNVSYIKTVTAMCNPTK